MTTWKDSLQRRDEVKAAFLEGVQRCCVEPLTDAAKEKHWSESQARQRLEKPLAD